ncbi:competence protein [Virgibacillus profundi]|uniref:Competence protein n=1 Tax=Virgibacillus profundi TaxID=2024555 RepID=A0A2A2ID14_9BACI|nr:competence protein ComK [Virgibacillus profundi]PAV29268.1 competence protein [Virgibacillus profundi]PXY53437.1 competence protein [Virgibacillus profundi]
MLSEYYIPSYEITPMTLAIVAKQDRLGTLTTFIFEEEEEYVVDRSPSKIIDYACKFFGASLKGRQDGTRDICGITHKAPISIDPTSGMYFFPTTSPTNSKCSWIAHSHIDKVNRAANHCAQVVFKNGRKVILDVSYGSVLNQVQRTAQFRYLLDNRIKFLQQHKAEVVAEPASKAPAESFQPYSEWQD